MSWSDTVDWVHDHKQTRTNQHSCKITEKTPEQHFEGNYHVCSRQTETNTTRMTVVITLWVSLTKYQTINFIMNSCEWLPLLPIDFISSQQWVYNDLLKVLGKQVYKICVLSFCCISRSNVKTQWWCWLAF